MIVLYAALAGAADVVAGWFALRQGEERIQRRYVIAFAAGVLLAVTFFDILPATDLKADAAFLALGFFSFYVLEKLLMIHACGESECETHHIGPVAVLGMALDNIVDGAGIAVGYLVDPFLGLAITGAVILHEIPQGMTSAMIMRQAKWSRRATLLALGFAGLLYPVGAMLGGLVPAALHQKMLAFVAGDFLYIAAGDLLPEAHRRFNVTVVLCVIGGMAFVLALGLLGLEP